MNKSKLRYIIKITKGKKELLEEVRSDEAKRYIQIDDLRNDSNVKWCIPNSKSISVNERDVIIAWDGANAGTIGYNLIGVIGSTLAKLTLTTNLIYPFYLGKYLKTHSKYLRDNCTGATIPHISKTTLENLEIQIPSIETQKKIVEVLDKAQELIDLRKKQIELLDELIQSIFYDMFGDPVSNPKGWGRGTIRDLCSDVKYGTSKKADLTNGEFEILRMNNITYKGFWNFSSLKYVDLDEKDKEKYLVKKGDLLFNRTNSKELVGKSAVYNRNKPMVYAGYLIRIRVNALANSMYIWAYLNSIHGKLTLENMCKNIVGMANINAQELQDIEICIPPLELQNQFSVKVQEIEQQKQKMYDCLLEMENNFNCLMQRAFNGTLFNN